MYKCLRNIILEESQKGVQENTKKSFLIKFNFITCGKTPPTEMSNLITSLHFLLFLPFLQQSAHVVALSCLLFYIYVLNLWSGGGSS